MKAFANKLKRVLAVIFTIVLIADLVPYDAVSYVYAANGESGSIAAGNTDGDNVNYPDTSSTTEKPSDDSSNTNSSDVTNSTDTTNSGKTDSTDSGKTDSTDSGKTDSTDSGKTDSTDSGKTDSTDSGKTDSTDSGKTDSTDSSIVSPGAEKPDQTDSEILVKPDVEKVIQDPDEPVYVDTKVTFTAIVKDGQYKDGKTFTPAIIWRDSEGNELGTGTKLEYTPAKAGTYTIKLFLAYDGNEYETESPYEIIAKDKLSVQASPTTGITYNSVVTFKAELSNSDDYTLEWYDTYNDGEQDVKQLIEGANALELEYTALVTGVTHRIVCEASHKTLADKLSAYCDIAVNTVELKPIAVEEPKDVFAINEDANKTCIDIDEKSLDVDFNNNGGSERTYTVEVVKPDGTTEILTAVDETNAIYSFPREVIGIYTVNVKCETGDEKANPKSVQAVIKYTVRQPLEVKWNGSTISKVSDGGTAVKIENIESFLKNFTLSGFTDADDEANAVLGITDIAKAEYANKGPGKNIAINLENSDNAPFFTLGWKANYEERGNFYYIKTVPDSICGDIVNATLANGDIDLTEENDEWKLELVDTEKNSIGVTLKVYEDADGVSHMQNSWFNAATPIIAVDGDGAKLKVYDNAEDYSGKKDYQAPQSSSQKSVNKVEGIYVEKKDGTVYGPISVTYNFDTTVPDFGGMAISTDQTDMPYTPKTDYKATSDAGEGDIKFTEDGGILVVSNQRVTLSDIKTQDLESGPESAYVEGNGVFCSTEKITTYKDISNKTFTESATIEPAETSQTYYVYVKLVDIAGNISYRGIDGTILSDKTTPTATITFNQANAGEKASLKIAAVDDLSGIYSIAARVYDGYDENGPIIYSDYQGEDGYWYYNSEEAPGTLKVVTEELSLDKQGSQQSVMIIIKDYAGNTKYYDHRGTEYTSEDECKNGMTLEKTFKVYSTEMSVNVSYTPATGVETKAYVKRGSEEKPDYIVLDRTEILAEFNNIPETDFSYIWQGEKCDVTSDEYNVKTHCYTFEEFKGDTTADGEYTFVLNIPELEGEKQINVTGLDEFATVDNGVYTDRFIKDATAPKVKFKVDTNSAVEKDSIYYYGLKDGIKCDSNDDCEDIVITVEVAEPNWYKEDIPKLYITYTDVNGNEKTSEAENVTWIPEDGVHSMTYTITSKSDQSTDGSYKFLLSNTGEDGEYVNYHDYGGTAKQSAKYEPDDQKWTYVIDTVRPEFTYSIDNTSYNKYEEKYKKGEEEVKEIVAYFKAQFSETFTVTDNNIADENITVQKYYKKRPDDEDWNGSGIKIKDHKAVIKAESDGIYYCVINGTDLAGNEIKFVVGENTNATEEDLKGLNDANGTTESPVKFKTQKKVLDTTAPKVAYTITGLDANHQYSEADYYKDPFEVKFEVTELNFDANKIKAEGFSRADSGDTHTYTCDIGTQGEYTFTISGEDKAGNPIAVTKEEGNTSLDPDDGTGSYTTHKKILDQTAPKYTVTEMTQPKSADNVEGDRAYFNSDVSVTFAVTDTYLDEGKVQAAVASNTGAANYATETVDWKGITLSKPDSETKKEVERTERTVKASADGLHRFEIAGEDKAGNKLEFGADKDKKAYNKTEKHADGEFWTMIKVIDTVAPVGEILIGNGKSNYYTADLKPAKVLEVKSSEPYRKETSASGTVRVASDKSPVKIQYPLTSQVGGSSQPKLVGDYTYNNSVTFGAKGEQVFYLTVTLTDRAGNTTGPIKTNSIYLDVTPPTEDTLAPSISIVAHSNSSAHGPSGNPLFSSSVPFNVVVSDPNATAKSSGLAEITYEILVDGVVKNTGTLNPKGSTKWNGKYDDPSLTYKIEKSVTADSSLNSNNIVIRVKAADHSGNTSQKEYNFGIDITAPKISVTYDNNDVQNDKYFKADRTATIVVTERNFDPGRINITTNGGSQSDWSFSNNGGNGDNDTWTKRITYSSDGDYTFDISGSDLLGHQASDITYSGAAPREFTVDKTVPVITISFDIGEGYQGSKYFNETRTGTVNILEHNFRASDARVESPGSISRGDQPTASQGGWGDSGDNHSMSIVFDQDGDYTITANYTDLAGNVALVATADEFTIDKTKPEIEFDNTTVQANHAYQGVIAPRITFSDTNYDPAGVTFTLTGIKDSRGKVLNLTEVFSDETGYGGSISYENFANIRANDDVYTATGIIVDRAGNKSEVTITFSVNRFGSTWDYNEDKTTEGLIYRYTNDEKDVYLREINVNEITDYSIIMTHDSEVRELKEGADYEVKASEAAGWKQYVYKFFKSNFEAEGTYNIVVQTKDAAGNSNTNSSMKNENGSEAVPLMYSIDKTSPYAVLDGVDLDEKLYNQASLPLFVQPFDALSGVYKIEIFIYPNNAADDAREKTEPAYMYENTEKDNALERILQANNNEVPFEIGQHNSPQTVKVVTYDAAGNVSEMLYTSGEVVKGEILWDGVLVSTSVASQVFYNRPLFIGLIAALLILLLALFLIWKRRKDQEKMAG